MSGLVIRWRFMNLTTSDEIILPINPNQMSTPTTPRNLSWAWGSRWGEDRMRGFDAPSDTPNQWTFGGVIYVQTHYDLLLEWAGLLTPIRIQDHLGRRFRVVIQRFDPIEKQATATKPWRSDYTMTCLLLERFPDA